MNGKLPFNLDKVLHNVSKVTLKGGLAGKICYVLIFVALSMAIIAWSVKILWVSAVALALIFILSFVFLWRLMNLAGTNPQSALMEGAEFLAHEHLMVGMKGRPEIEITSGEFTESAPLDLSPSEEKQLEVPDPGAEKQLIPGSTEAPEHKGAGNE